MRILLTANASYIPARGGATRSNLIWLDALAHSGSECRIVCSALPDSEGKRRQLRDEEIAGSWDALPNEGAVERFRKPGVEVCAAADPARRTALLRDSIRHWNPDWVLVSSEDLGHVLLREAHREAAGRVVYIGHTPQFFPFGPASWNPDPAATAVVEQAAGAVTISRYVADYVRAHTGRDAAVIHPPIYGEPPWPEYRNFGAGLAVMINPCAVKGISLFLAMADRMPEQRFGAVPGWGTTTADRAELRKRPNIEILPNVPDIEQMLARASVLLMPSLWHEGFGLIVMEAMLRGVPAITSDAGGLVEAKAGTRFVIPVKPIGRYENAFDEHALPRAVVEPNPVEPWVDALRKLLSSRELYERESEASRAAALRFVSNLRAGALAEYLARLSAPAAAPSGHAARAGIESLSPEKRALLLRRLKTKTPA